MTIQRLVFLVVLIIQAGVTAAAQQNVLPQWTPFLALIGTVLTALMSSIVPKDPPPPAGPSKVAAFLLLVGALAVAGAVSACGVFTKQNAKSALDVAQVLCVIANASTDDATVAKVCAIEADLMPVLKQLLAEQRKQVAAARRAGACGPDAGTP